MAYERISPRGLAKTGDIRTSWDVSCQREEIHSLCRKNVCCSYSPGGAIRTEHRGLGGDLDVNSLMSAASRTQRTCTYHDPRTFGRQMNSQRSVRCNGIIYECAVPYIISISYSRKQPEGDPCQNRSRADRVGRTSSESKYTKPYPDEQGHKEVIEGLCKSQDGPGNSLTSSMRP